MQTAPVLLLFVDGIGLPSEAQQVATPLRDAVCPRLMQLLQDHSVPIDATLGVPGYPQSATGQTTILTGVNAAAELGRHVEGFPGRRLREIIMAHNLYAQLAAEALSATFANGYLAATVAEVRAMRRQSVTTVAALQAFGDVRRLDALLQHQAVAHDLTRETLASRGYQGDCISIAQAARDLIGIARAHDFTLFEYFETDRAGHRADPQLAETVLRKLDAFLSFLVPMADAAGILLLLTSDHGNIEDPSTRSHTMNPVPLVAYGPGAHTLLPAMQVLTEITPAVLRHFRPAPQYIRNDPAVRRRPLPDR